jgi:DNA-binding CsgD family transcriptional regulator
MTVPLTAREREIVELFARGLTYAETAQVLGISKEA